MAVVTRQFGVGDKVVYPSHGVGEIVSVQSKAIGGSSHSFYEIKVVETGMRIMIPVAQVDSVGLRKVADKKTIERVYQILKDRKARIHAQTWNRRYREYTQKIKTGSLFEMAEVLRDLSILSKSKELSYGEKKMFETVRDMLVSEISISKARAQERVRGELLELVPVQ